MCATGKCRLSGYSGSLARNTNPLPGTYKCKISGIYRKTSCISWIMLNKGAIKHIRLFYSCLCSTSFCRHRDPIHTKGSCGNSGFLQPLLLQRTWKQLFQLRRENLLAALFGNWIITSSCLSSNSECLLGKMRRTGLAFQLLWGKTLPLEKTNTRKENSFLSLCFERNYHYYFQINCKVYLYLLIFIINARLKCHQHKYLWYYHVTYSILTTNKRRKI